MHARRTPLGRSARPAALALAIIAALAPLWSTGCGGGAGRGPNQIDSSKLGIGGKEGEVAKVIAIEEIAAQVAAFADSWVETTRSATDLMLEGETTPEMRRTARRLFLESALSMYDIATNPDTVSQIFNIGVMTQLLYTVWVDDGRAQEEFGDRGVILADAVKRLRGQGMSIVKNALTESQVDVLTELVRQWRERNPQVHGVAFVRFRQFADVGGTWLREQVQSSAGGGLFASVDAATEIVRQTKALGERARWLAVRYPLILVWTADSTADDFLTKSEVVKALSNLSETTTAATSLTKSVDRLPADITAQREAVFAEIDKRQADLNDTLAIVGKRLDETQKVVDSVKQIEDKGFPLIEASKDAVKELDTTLKTLDKVLARFDKPKPEGAPPPEPFKIDDYTKAVAQLTVAVKELNTLVTSSGDLLDSKAWTKRLDEVNQAAESRMTQASQEGAQVVNRAGFWGVALVIAAGITTLLVAILIPKLRKPRPTP